MGWASTIRAMEAAAKREQREAQRRQRELVRRAKEQAKLTAIEQARLEVETYENKVEVLLSVHKEQGPVWDWTAIFASLPPPYPQKNTFGELRARQQLAVLPPDKCADTTASIEEARKKDEEAYLRSLEIYAEQKGEWERMKSMSCRILAGEQKAYTEALVELSPLAELSELGSTIHFTIHDAFLVECNLKVNGLQAIPSEVKTLTASEKLSVKPMPKARFHELYQDYICGCMLRVAREVFALLPIKTLLITATADTIDSNTGQSLDQAVLSAAMIRESMNVLNFDYVAPSDAMDNFLHRGDFKATRKTGAFAPILPLTPSELPGATRETAEVGKLLGDVRRLREELKSDLAGFGPCPIPLEP